MTQAQLKNINCTNCGAPLELRGGHQVHSRTCEYCGSVLDTQAEYAVVAQYKKMKDKMPDLPLKIGMTGMLYGVEFSIIGFLEYSYRDDDEEERWVSYQLYSPTHGYVWLTWEYGTPKRYQFSRRVRSWSPNYERVKNQYTAEVTFVAGELTWIAKLGDRVRMGQTYEPNISFEKSQDEDEYYINKYLNTNTVHRAFGAEPIPDGDARKKKGDVSGGCLVILVLFIVILVIIFAVIDEMDGGYGGGYSYSSSSSGSRSSSGSFSSFGK